MKNLKVALYSVPRSGSSWLGEIINSSPVVNYSYQPLFSYEFKSKLNENSQNCDIDSFFKDISQTKNEFIRQLDDRRTGKKPSFVKAEMEVIVYKEVRYIHIIRNLLEKNDDIKIIGLVRNPLSVLSSWKNAPREFRIDLGWEFEKEWQFASLKNEGKKEEYFGYNKWKEAALLFEDLKKHYPERFHLVKYDDLIFNLESTVCALFEFLNIPITEQTIAFLNTTSLKGKSGTYSVYNGGKSQDDSWKKNLPENIVNKIIADCKNSSLEKYL